jgi:hypothetical protein
MFNELSPFINIYEIDEPTSSRMFKYCYWIYSNISQSPFNIMLTTDWTTGVRTTTDAKGFSSCLCVQITSEVHIASFSMGTGGSFPGG